MPIETPSQQLKPQFVQIPGLAEYRAMAAQRRAEAFCEAPEAIMGVRVISPTPATFSMLVAAGSRFLGSQTALPEDVAFYLWIHSPDYCHTGVDGWSRCKRRALRPFSLALRQPWRKWLGLGQSLDRKCAIIATASDSIEKALNDAFADAPERSGNPGKPIATLEAQLIVEFARELHWTPQQTRHTPLKQIFQLYRCIRLAGGEDVQDAGESALTAAHLRRRNEELQRERDAQKEAA